MKLTRTRPAGRRAGQPGTPPVPHPTRKAPAGLERQPTPPAGPPEAGPAPQPERDQNRPTPADAQRYRCSGRPPPPITTIMPPASDTAPSPRESGCGDLTRAAQVRRIANPGRPTLSATAGQNHLARVAADLDGRKPRRCERQRRARLFVMAPGRRTARRPGLGETVGLRRGADTKSPSLHAVRCGCDARPARTRRGSISRLIREGASSAREPSGGMVATSQIPPEVNP
jgi:hypothetical protein